MCLNIKETTKEQLAKENLPCYKHLMYNNSSPRGFKYKRFRKNQEVDIKPVYDFYSVRNEDSKKDRILEHGYHSRRPNSIEPKKDLFIIPKGSKYYIGRENSTNYLQGLNGFVSSNIVYIGKNNMFNRWIGKIFFGVKFMSEKYMRDNEQF